MRRARSLGEVGKVQGVAVRDRAAADVEHKAKEMHNSAQSRSIGEVFKAVGVRTERFYMHFDLVVLWRSAGWV